MFRMKITSTGGGVERLGLRKFFFTLSTEYTSVQHGCDRRLDGQNCRVNDIYRALHALEGQAKYVTQREAAVVGGRQRAT